MALPPLDSIEEEKRMVEADLAIDNDRKKAISPHMTRSVVLWVVRTGVTPPRVEGRPVDRIAVLWLEAQDMLVIDGVESLSVCGDVEENPGPGTGR